MDIKKLDKNNKRLQSYLKKHSISKRELMDIVKRIEIEEAKPMLERYMCVSKTWYKDRETYLETLLLWIEKRMQLIIKNMEYGN